MALKIDFSNFDPLQLILRVSDIKIWLVLSKSDQNKSDWPIFEPFLQNAFSLSIWELGAVYVNDMKIIVVSHKFHFFFNSFLPSFEQNFTKLLFCVTQASSSFAVTQQKVSNFLYTICPDDLSECYVHNLALRTFKIQSEARYLPYCLS